MLRWLADSAEFILIQSPIREHNKFNQVLVIYLINFVKHSDEKTDDGVVEKARTWMRTVYDSDLAICVGNLWAISFLPRPRPGQVGSIAELPVHIS